MVMIHIATIMIMMEGALVKALASPWQQLTGSLSLCSPQTLIADYDYDDDYDDDDDLVDGDFLLPLLLSQLVHEVLFLNHHCFNCQV